VIFEALPTLPTIQSLPVLVEKIPSSRVCELELFNDEVLLWWLVDDVGLLCCDMD
jgi:hypothetical protein